MDRRLLPLLFALALPLSACDRSAPPPDAPATAGGTPPVPADQAAVEESAATSGLPKEFVVHANEPFWQARVEAGDVVLSGPDVAGRRFRIDAEGDADGGRQVRASDASGTIQVTLMPGPCQDSMSGAEFPHAAELVIDGGDPATGCARPTDMPPPGEPGL